MAEPLSCPPHARTQAVIYIFGWRLSLVVASIPPSRENTQPNPPSSLQLLSKSLHVCRMYGCGGLYWATLFCLGFLFIFFLYIYISRYIVQRVYIEMYIYLVRLRDRWRRAWYIRDKRYFFPFSSHGRFQTSSAGQSTYNNGIGSSEYTEEESCDGWCDVSRRLTQTPRNLPNSYIRVVYIV